MELMSRPPNILWFCTDQQRFDTIGALNNAYINTPNLDRLVGEGVAFTHAHCQNQICTPSRTSFLTGMYPSSIRACICGNEEYSGAAPLVTRLLAEAGYVCGLAGKLHIASPWLGPEKRVEDGYSFFRYSHSPFSRLDQGNDYMQWLLDQEIDPASVFTRKPPGQDTEFASYLPSVKPEIHQTTWCTDETIRFIGDNRDRPWLMSVNVFDPHGPFDPPEEYRRRYDVDDLPGPHFEVNDLEIQTRLEGVDFPNKAMHPDAFEAKDKMASYYAMVELIDHNVGRLLDYLDETGEREDTLIIFTSDHGKMLGDHGLISKGCRFYEGLVRVPLIMALPSRFRADMRSDALVGLIDIAPTLLDLAGVAPPPLMQGRSLLPILEGKVEPDSHRDFVRCEFYHTDEGIGTEWKSVGSRANMVRDRRFKLVVYHGQEYGELYDLKEDPWEHVNLWESGAHQSVKSRLMRTAFDSVAFSVELGPSRIGRY